MQKPAEQNRSEVAKAYAEAVTAPARTGCCGPAPTPNPAGYSREALASVPEGAAAHSFGCGDPVALAGLAPGDVVVDLGSGAGIDLFLAAERVGPGGRVIGVDMTEEMIAQAKENIRASGRTNIEARRGLIEDLPVESGSVDWVISNCVINLSPEKEKVFREIARVLKPGGRMLVSDIVARDLPESVREAAGLYASCIGGAISEEDYLAGLREAGLVDVAVRARLVYDAGQLQALAGESCGCAARALAGKIWSAKVYARKPA